MICDEFEKLTPKEKTEFIGQVVHSIQSDTYLYSMGRQIIKLGQVMGLFEGVKILHDNNEDNLIRNPIS